MSVSIPPVCGGRYPSPGGDGVLGGVSLPPPRGPLSILRASLSKWDPVPSQQGWDEAREHSPSPCGEKGSLG